jgi:hypothetical protein
MLGCLSEGRPACKMHRGIFLIGYKHYRFFISIARKEAREESIPLETIEVNSAY